MAHLDCFTKSVLLEWPYAEGATSYTAVAESSSGGFSVCSTNHTNCEMMEMGCGQVYTVTVVASDDRCNSSQSPSWDIATGTSRPVLTKEGVFIKHINHQLLKTSKKKKKIFSTEKHYDWFKLVMNLKHMVAQPIFGFMKPHSPISSIELHLHVISCVKAFCKGLFAKLQHVNVTEMAQCWLCVSFYQRDNVCLLDYPVSHLVNLHLPQCPALLRTLNTSWTAAPTPPV